MRILILNWRDPNNPKSGGAEIVTMEHAKAWVLKGHHVTWFTSMYKGGHHRTMSSGVEIIRKGNSLTVFLWACLFYLFSGVSFDVIVDEIHGLPFFTPLYVRRPIVVFIHEVANEIWDIMYPTPVNILGKMIERLYLRLYRHFYFWTDARQTINDLVRFGIDRSKCIAIPCPPTSSAITSLPKKAKEPTFIFVSRIVKMKGIEDVIDAFVQIANTIENAKLWIIGTGEPTYVRDIKRRIALYHVSHRISFFGYVSQKKKLTCMRKSHILLHASIKEGWGLVVLEAASQGTPSVVYNVSGLSEVVKHNSTGIVTESSPSALAAAAITLYQDNRMYNLYQKNGIVWAKSLRWKDATKQSLTLLTNVYETRTITNY